MFEGVGHACRLTLCVCELRHSHAAILQTLSARTYVICDLDPWSNGERTAGDIGEKGIKGGKKVAGNKGEKEMIPRGISNAFSSNRKTFAAVNT